MFSKAYDFFDLFFGRIFEEEAVGVAIKDLNAYVSTVVENLGDAVAAYSGCGFSNWWTIEVEAFSAEDSVAGVKNDFEGSLSYVVPVSLLLR